MLARAAGGAVEGAIYGGGSGVSDLALFSDPLTWERAASVIGSNALFDAGVGGIAGGGSALVEKGLAKAGAVLDEHLARARCPGCSSPRARRHERQGAHGKAFEAGVDGTLTVDQVTAELAKLQAGLTSTDTAEDAALAGASSPISDHPTAVGTGQRPAVGR